MSFLKSLARICGENNSPGIKGIIYLAEVCDIDTFPPTVLQSEPASTDPLAEITMSAAITMVASKTFKYFDIILDSGKLQAEKIGERGSAASSNKLPFRIVGSRPRQMAAYAQLIKWEGVGVVEMNAGAERFIIGTKARPAWVTTANMDSGDALTAANGTEYTIQADDALPWLYYPSGLALAIDPG